MESIRRNLCTRCLDRCQWRSRTHYHATSLDNFSDFFWPRQLHWFSSEHADSKFLALIGRATVYAVNDIVAGEELLTKYIGRAHEPRAQRQSSLLQRLGFRCNLQACPPSSPFGKASNKRRKRSLEDQRLSKITQGSNVHKNRGQKWKNFGRCN